jgi:hypothetical protein
MSPVNRVSDAPLVVGDYWVNLRIGVMVEILEIDLSGNAIVTDVRLDSDKSEPVRLAASAFGSALWQRMDRDASARAA